MGVQERRERERQARIESILTAAAHVFAERGYVQATMDEIADRAELGKGTLYLYFSSKEDLACELLKRGLEQLQEQLEAEVDPSETPADQIRQMIAIQVRHVQANREVFAILAMQKEAMSYQLREEIHKRLEATVQRHLAFVESILQRGIEQGAFVALPVRALSTALGGIFHGFIRQWQRGHLLDQGADTIADIFLKGIER